ncbi:MAG: prepilin-type N-terminal cleavage/methylation domain-containing protein, partial [Phycisphaerae bacterium]|nr:prepilin-type N-terminal cleavage/methylation domain-containing protein [Phycisphaerae bacterium]
MRRTTRIGRRQGFSLIEAAVATAIIGIGVVALLAAIRAGTHTNEGGRKLTQAVFLA